MTVKTFDCIEQKRKAQAALMARYEAEKGKHASFAAFVREHARRSAEVQELRQRLGMAPNPRIQS